MHNVCAVLRSIAQLGSIESKCRFSVSSFYRPAENCQIPNLAGKWEALFGRRNHGYFVEVGAYDGENFSNTSCLADVGWSGLYIEPVSEFAERCQTRHKNNSDVSVLVAAASDREGSAELFLGDTLTTLNQDRLGVYDRIEWAKGHHSGASKTVRTSTLDTLLESQKVSARFDLLVIDVEGAEEKVLFGFDLPRWRPKVMVIELEDFHPDFEGNDDIVLSARRVRERLLSVGYAEYYRDGINTIFVDEAAFGAVPNEIEFPADVPPRVTIALPTHNGAKTLRRTLDGILAQDFPHFDLVISDNASTDETAKIIEEYSTKFDRISVKHRPAKIPATDEFLSLLDGCNTEFFVWVSDGDWWEPRFLGECVARLTENPAIHLTFSDFRIYYHLLDAYSARDSYASSDSNNPQLNFLIRLFDAAPYASYGVCRTDALKAVCKELGSDFVLPGLVLTRAIALRGRISIVKQDLFRVGVRGGRSMVRLRALDGGRIEYLRFFRKACALAVREFGLKSTVLLIPQMAHKIYQLWRRDQFVSKSGLEVDVAHLYRRHELPIPCATNRDEGWSRSQPGSAGVLPVN